VEKNILGPPSRRATEDDFSTGKITEKSGVKGLDLSNSGKSSMSRRQGWPRKQSLQNTNANDNSRLLADRLSKVAAFPVATPMMPAMALSLIP
jgi:hypothetical protein